MSNLADLGLLELGFTLAARLLDYPNDFLYLTNLVVEGQGYMVRFFPGTGVWGAPEPFTPTFGLPFPYDESVEPP